MRFTEFKLLEATLQRTSTTSWPGYLENLLNAQDIGVGPQGERNSGQQLAPKSKRVVKALINAFEVAPNKIEFAKQIEETELLLIPSNTMVPIKHIFKSAEIKGGSTASGSEKKPWNEGEVAETILGAALYARFISKNKVTAKEVWAALKTFTNNVIPGGFEVAGTKRNKKSPITMTAINKPLNNKVINDLVHNKASLDDLYPSGVKALEDKISACADYVNESVKVKSAIEKADASPGAPITIRTDGVGDQKGTKADLQINVGDWVQLLSLKVNDVKQFGQQSGSSGAVVTEYFKRFIPSIDLSKLYMRNGEPIPWTPETGKGWPDMDNKKATNQLRANGLWDAALDQVYKLTGMAYEIAGATLNKQLAADPGQVVTDLYNGIIHHVQGNAQFQTLVILNPDTKHAWKELEFGPELEKALAHYKLEAVVEVAPARGAGNHRLRIFGTPITPEAIVAQQAKINSKADAKKAKAKADSGNVAPVAAKEMLFQLRSYQQESGNMRNPVEMGPLLKNLTEVQAIEELSDETTVDQQAKVVPQEVPQQPVPQSRTVAQSFAQTGQPSGMTNIAPAGDITSSPLNSEEKPDELDTIKKNAGIVVESK